MTASSWARSAVLAASLVATTTVYANRYTLVDLGPMLTRASINDSDAVSGTGWGPDGFHPHAKLFTGDHWHKLAKSESSAEAINAAGDVVGDFGGREAAVLWRRHQPATVLPLPGDATGGIAHGINGTREVVGTYVLAGHNKCFKWTESTGSVDLGLMGRGLDCGAIAINGKGQVTGAAASRNFMRKHAFRFEAGEFQDLGSLTPGDRASPDFSEGVAINEHGDIVGDSAVHGGKTHAVLWRGLELIDLNRGTPYETALALDINDHGDIVGFLWDEYDRQRGARFTDPGIVLLDSEVSNLGPWRVITATGVNQHGNIVAQAVGPGGVQRTVLLRLESAE